MYRIDLRTQPSPQASSRRSRVRRHLHAIYFAIAFIAFFIPLLTNPLLKEEDPELQTRVKLLSYLTMTIAGILGVANELSTATLRERRLSDSDMNADFYLERQQRKLRFSGDSHKLTIQQDLRTLGTAQSGGVLGATYIPGQFQGAVGFPAVTTIDIQPTALPISNQVKTLANSFTIPTANDTADQDNEEVVRAYKHIHDRSKRTSLNTLIFGSTGDCKTTAMHMMLHSWLQDEPLLVPMICDRKFFSSSDPNWRSNWCGLPVYRDIGIFTSFRVPFPSIYAAFKPDLEEWLHPLYKLVEFRCGGGKLEDDPLYDPNTRTRRPVMALIDDASLIMSSYPNDKRTRTMEKLKEIMSLGRSEKIDIFFIAHTNIDSELQIGSLALEMMEPIVGSSFVQNTNRMQWNKRPIEAEGIQRAAESRKNKARGFATSWEEAPYLPPANISGMEDFIIPELSIAWHKTAPLGFEVQEYHQKCFLEYSFDFTKRDEFDLATMQKLTNASETVPMSSENATPERDPWENDTISSLVAVRQWYRSQTEAPTDEALLNTMSQVFEQSIAQVQPYLATMKRLIHLSDSEFSQAVQSPDSAS
ncbi:hypothetical protein ACQ4M3_01225 [Leptolyngbya sp. AN03gr2]|uniref:hypothetical protein n=1 Tax=unclassified Leptolyngbya TaxID=2650499 RepID=UPI003D31CCD4